LHVTFSQQVGTDQCGGDDFRSLKGYDVKGAISLLYDVNRIRIELPASFDAVDRYDFSVVAPEPESQDQMNERFRQGIQAYFHLAATRENRLMDVYVVTSSGRKPPAAKPQNTEGGESFASWVSTEEPAGQTGDPAENAVVPESVSIKDIRGIVLEGPMDQFCHTLEQELDLLVVNETNLKGRLAFDVKVPDESKNDFLDRLHDQLGLIVTQAQRNVEILVFNPPLSC
jgi:uncharacterized protein (TIGR03435 family)